MSNDIGMYVNAQGRVVGCWDGKEVYPHEFGNLARKAVEERDRYKAVVEWMAAKRDLLFAECSDAEEIVVRCREALKAGKV